MPPLSPTDRPHLRRGVRTAIDPLSDETVLLFPEGVLTMNETAAAVVLQCNGARSVAEVVQAVREVYDDVEVGDVTALLEELIVQNLLMAGDG
ncbi:MAG: pyrroloquinoline quinone biosynthesis peptide chaperone PqqD [Pseudonocardiaceae bacterium]